MLTDPTTTMKWIAIDALKPNARNARFRAAVSRCDLYGQDPSLNTLTI
jgi:hypothetical protein